MIKPVSVIVTFIDKYSDDTDGDARYSNAERHCDDYIYTRVQKLN